MNEIQLIEKLKEYEDTQNKIIYSIKECVNSINERLTLVYGEGFNIVDNNTPFTSNFNSPFNQYYPSSRIYWNYVGDKKMIFFYYNGDGKTYSINNEGRDIYFGNPSSMNKIINANNSVIVEYIKFILQIKEQIINEIKNKKNSLEEMADELNEFSDDIKPIIP
jgi:hypothetical protein